MNEILVIWDQYLPESMKWNFGNMGLVSSNNSPDGQCWQFWKGRGGGWGWGHCNETYFGGSNTICVNDRFEKETEHLHCGVTIKTFRS